MHNGDYISEGKFICLINRQDDFLTTKTSKYLDLRWDLDFEMLVDRHFLYCMLESTHYTAFDN